MEHYKISIIIPTYNDVEALDMTIQSILKSDFKDYEILICDDGSNVDNLSIVRKYEYPIRNVIKFIFKKLYVNDFTG
ncbi:MAG: glycosyltransferase family 2 protein, partial [Erysipelotrichaceae bacterium]|nr:glycosyltransferase family 2 protein [Erysipelotrichaceae bacterium]